MNMKNFNFKNGAFYEECQETGQRCVEMTDTAGRTYIFRADSPKQITVQFQGSKQAVIRVRDGKIMSIS